MNPPSAVHAVGSASIWVLGRAAGPRRSAPVLHAGPDAVYVNLEGSCLGLLGARAVQVPCGVRTMLRSLPEVAADAEAVVHDGAIELPGLEVLVTNIVDTTVPVLSPQTAAWGGGRLEELVSDRLQPVRKELPDDLLTALSEADPTAVTGLLGLGGGLTPLGDDVLAGWMASAVAGRHPGLPEIRGAVALSATERTSTLSATLLACAARGEAIPEFRSLLRGMADGNLDVVEQSCDLLFQVGDSSGAGLVLGGLLALQSPSLLSPLSSADGVG